MVSERLTVKMSCYMNYEWFPFDSQVCPVLLESYAYRAHQLVVEWHEEDPFQVDKFKIQQASFTSCGALYELS